MTELTLSAAGSAVLLRYDLVDGAGQEGLGSRRSNGGTLMELGLYSDTHGLAYRDGSNYRMHDVPGTQMRTVRIAQKAEALGYHSLWFPNHVCMPLQSTSGHVANASRQQAYRPHHNILDAAVAMGAVAASTTRLKLATSVLIAPYRGPLNDARQLATLDVLSNRRVIVGVGAGWLQEEFEALGLPYAERGAMTEECIEIYKRSWTEDVVSFHGRYHDFANLSMAPKPVQKPRPPIIFGSVVPAGARRAARTCDGLSVIFLDPGARPERFAHLHTEALTELERVGSDPSTFAMLGVAAVRVTCASDPASGDANRPLCTGTPDQILSDLEAFAEHGYSLLACFFDCPSGDMDELEEQGEWFGREVLLAAKQIHPRGPWQTQW